MPRGETVTTPPTLGAGRRYSYCYSPWGISSNLSDPNASVTAMRPNGIVDSNFYNVVVTGAPPAPRGTIIYNGRVAWAMTSNTVPTGYVITPSFAVVNRPLVMTPFSETLIPGVNLRGIDDYWCWSVSAVLAFDAIPGAIVGDVGITVGVGTRAQIRGAAQFAGVELGPTNTGTIGVVIRQADGGAITLAQDVAGVADMTAFHKYEIRLVGPTLTAEAQFKFLIDGTVQLAVPYGAGTVLPPQGPPAPTNLGFTPGIVNHAANAATTRMYFAPFSFAVCAAPTEEALP